MKKLLFLSGLMLFASLLFAQPQEQISDGGFENNWHSQPLPSSGTYEDWIDNTDMLRTLNNLYGLQVQIYTTALTSFKETSTPYGNYALKMQTVRFNNGEGILVPGTFGTISKTFVDEFLATQGIEVFSYFESKPKRLTGYYKYAPVNNDSASIEIELRNYDYRAAHALWKVKTAVPEWTPFEIPINYENDWFDIIELKLIFASSAGYNFTDLENCKGQVGSTFWIDDIAFRYDDTGLCEPLMNRISSKAFPNPANTTVTISFDKILEGKLVIYNLLGAEVATQPVTGNSVETNVSHLAAGSYFYRVIEGNLIRTSGKFIVEF